MTRAPGFGRLVTAAALAASLGLAGPAALAQADPEGGTLPERLDELPGEVEQAMRGLIDRMRPAIEHAGELMDLLDRIDSPANYEKPVILPNGDILIRRSPDAPEWDPGEEGAGESPEESPPRELDPDEGTRI